MREHPYLIQLKIPSEESMFGEWSDGKKIRVSSDNEAATAGQKFADEQKDLGQIFDGFRVLKVVTDTTL